MNSDIDTSNMFTVMPMSQQIELKAGESYSGKIYVANPAAAKEDFSYNITASSYGVSGENYDVDFLSRTERTAIVDWIEIENPTGTLKPNETAEIRFVVKVPENAPAGGQYAILRVSSENNNVTNRDITIGNVFEMASILYAKVEGETKRGGEVIENRIPGFVTQLPITTSATITNEGNIHEAARVSVVIKSFFSTSAIYPKEGESGTIEEIIMPETTRYLTREINGVAQLGIYEVSQTISYLGETSVAKQTVIVCPLWFMLLAFVTVSALVLAIVKGLKARRRRKIVF